VQQEEKVKAAERLARMQQAEREAALQKARERDLEREVPPAP
jgi:hypothetical protein